MRVLSIDREALREAQSLNTRTDTPLATRLKVDAALQMLQDVLADPGHIDAALESWRIRRETIERYLISHTS